MTRTSDQIVADIRAFEPTGEDWRGLETLLTELWQVGDPAGYIPELLAVLERFPEEDGAGVLWSIVHGVESLPGYEPVLIQSVQRRPSELGVAMVGRLLNGGEREVNGVSLVTLLRSIAGEPGTPQRVRQVAATFAARHP
jgi:hypothetical protein